MSLLDLVGDALARETHLTPTQARGTLRLLLKAQGVPARIARKADMERALDGPLMAALEKRHVELDRAGLGRIRAALAAADEHEDAYDLFRDLD